MEKKARILLKKGTAASKITAKELHWNSHTWEFRPHTHNLDAHNTVFISMYISKAQAEYSYFSTHFKLKIFLFAVLDYRALYFIWIVDI